MANAGSNNVSVIDTATNTVTSTVNVGKDPIAFGQFIVPRSTQPILPIADFTSNVTSGYAPLSVQFTDLSENTTEGYWDFEDDGTVDSIDADPVHAYTVPRNLYR